MISTEKALDVLPFVAAMYEKIDFESFRTSIKTEGKTANQVGIEVFLFLVKNAGKIKTEIFETVAILDDKTAAEIKAQPLSKTLASLKELFSDPEIAGFFKQAVQ